jgi:osmotically-inducible protein OsmY
MAYQGRWREEDRYRLDDAERFRWDTWRDESDHGRSMRDQGNYGREFGRHYPSFRTENGYERWGGERVDEEDRGFMERASDEVSSWFGDNEAQRRRAMDALDGGRRGRGPKGYVRSDERIREDVCDFLSDDPLVDASEIEVAVAGSEVTLTGTVETRRERRRAEDCAERVSGVSHVQNNLRVARESVEGASIAPPSPPFI